MKTFAFEVSDEDFHVLERLQKLGYGVAISLDATTGGITVAKGRSSVEWSFISEVDGSGGKSYGDHREAIEALIQDDALAERGADLLAPGR